MDRLVSIPERDSIKPDGEKTAYVSKFRRICFNSDSAEELYGRLVPPDS